MELNPNFSEKASKDYMYVKAAINSDQQAYAELLSRYKDSIYFMLLKIVNNKDDAEDLTIEAFGKAFKNLHQYSPKYAFSTWLFKIANNNCIDFLRKKKSIVKKLKPRYRNLIELRYFKEYSYEEIANELELPLGTVKAQLFRARELLFNILKRSNGKI